ERVGAGPIAAGFQVTVEDRERDLLRVDVREQGWILGPSQRVVRCVTEQSDGVAVSIAISVSPVVVPSRRESYADRAGNDRGGRADDCPRRAGCVKPSQDHVALSFQEVTMIGLCDDSLAITLQQRCKLCG